MICLVQKSYASRVNTPFDICVHFKEKVCNSDEGDVDKSQRFLRVMNHDVVLKVGSFLVHITEIKYHKQSLNLGNREYK